MPGKIDLYVDVVSPYSYFAVLHLTRVKAQLAEHGVTINYHPMFLGGVMQGSGNKPPWTVPAKAQYGNWELQRAMKHFKTPNMRRPDVFPIMSLLPMRALVFVKQQHGNDVVEKLLLTLWNAYWESNQDISNPETLLTVFAKVLDEGSAKAAIQAGTSPEAKAGLAANTEKALKSGAYGAPWWMVTNAQGETSYFFGSDRFHYVYDFLEVPYEDIRIVARSARL